MKNLLITLITSATLLLIGSPSFGVETKRVCVDTRDKNGKEVKQCKNVKIHKKLDGTKVPDGKK